MKSSTHSWIFRLWPRRFVRQVTLLTSLMIALGTLTLTSYLVIEVSQFELSNSKERLGAIAETIGLGLTHHIAVHDYAEIEQLLLHATNYPGMRSLTVVDTSGRTLSEIRRKKGEAAETIFNHEKLTPPSAKSNHFEWKFGSRSQGNSLALGLDASELNLWHPIENGDFGWLKVSYSVENVLDDALHLIKNSLLIAVAGIVLLILTLSHLLQPSLRALSKATDFAHDLTHIRGQQIQMHSGSMEIEQLEYALNMTSQQLFTQDTALRRSSESLQRLLDSMAEGAYGINDKGICTFANPAFLKTLGYDNVSEVLGQPIHVLIHHSHADGSPYPIDECKIRCACITKEQVHVDDEVLWRKDGVAVPVEYWASPIMHDGKLLGVISTFVDISERQRINQMKREFVSTVSHELRTPLTSISGALGLLAGGALGEMQGQAKQIIEMAHKNSLRLNLLINDLLDMEKLLAGKMSFEFQVQPLMELVEQALESIHAYGEKYGVHFKCIAREEVQVNVDSNRLIQVLNNFLSNAAKFSAQGGQVEITVKRVNAAVRVEIIDHGAGIPEAFRGRIFQKFSQADSSDIRQKGGTGLGLAISKELIERMDGVIGFDSQEKHGSVFYFELPLNTTRVTTR